MSPSTRGQYHRDSYRAREAASELLKYLSAQSVHLVSFFPHKETNKIAYLTENQKEVVERGWLTVMAIGAKWEVEIDLDSDPTITSAGGITRDFRFRYILRVRP